jgi:TIR domain
MTARIFISYRSADGMDKATALARDLGRSFGEAAVFLDKDDLRGGTLWRQEVGRTLQSRPVLLLLMTPQLLDARDAAGQLRIADPADPVRRELESALEVGAHVIPVLCDGLAAAPDATQLPAPFHHIGELTWRKLRAYDWAHDVERIVADVQALGVPAMAPAATATPTAAPTIPVRTRDTGPRWAVAAGIASVGIALALWWAQQRPPATPSATASPASPTSPASPAAASVAGRWQATLWQGERVVVVVEQTAGNVTLASEPIAIAARPDWAEYRQFWRERFQADLNDVMYRGEGRLLTEPGQPPAVDIALKVLSVPAPGTEIDGGNLSATLSADGTRLTGKIWLNGAQAEQPATLQRIAP